MRLTKEGADKYEKQNKATRYWIMRMHCQNCSKVAGAVVSNVENPRTYLMNIKAAYLCLDCMNIVLDNIKNNNIPFNDAGIDRFQESMK